MLDRTLLRRKYYPDIITYQGGKTNNYDGTFAGITDVQGVDYYVGACAPHITLATQTMRLQGSFDYLKNTRNNHMPLPAWGYSQGFCVDCWNGNQLKPGELIVQLASVFAAGHKGFMMFQSDVREEGNDSWKKGGQIIRTFGTVSEYLRVGDLMEHGVTWDQDHGPSQVSVIHAPDALVVVVISWNGSGYNDLLCYTKISGHWNFKKLSLLAPSLGYGH